MTDRTKFLGASEIPAVLGISPFKSPLDVYLEKTGRLVQNPPSIQMRAGNYLEPLVIALFEEETGIQVVNRQAHLTLKDHPFISATIDGQTTDGALVECKTTGFSQGWGEPETDQVPDHVLVQCVQQMAVSGLSVVWIPVLIGRSDFRIYRVNRDEELEKMVIDRGIEFWEKNVLADMPPDPRTLEDVKKLFRVSRSEVVYADAPMREAVCRLREIKTLIKGLEEEEKALLFRVQDGLRESDTLMSEGKILVTWKTQDRTSLDQKILKEKYPDIFSECSKISSSRVFRLATAKE